LMIFNFGASDVTLHSFIHEGNWKTEIFSADSRWLGPGYGLPRTVKPGDTVSLPGQSFVVFSREGRNL
jgi:maltooligosyltrehalose trehalohydrolase